MTEKELRKKFILTNRAFFEKRRSALYWLKLYIWPFGLINQSKSIFQNINSYVPDCAKTVKVLEEIEADYFYKSICILITLLLLLQIFIGLSPGVIAGCFLWLFIRLGLSIRVSILIAKAEYNFAFLACCQS